MEDIVLDLLEAVLPRVCYLLQALQSVQNKTPANKGRCLSSFVQDAEA